MALHLSSRPSFLAKTTRSDIGVNALLVPKLRNTTDILFRSSFKPEPPQPRIVNFEKASAILAKMEGVKVSLSDKFLKQYFTVKVRDENDKIIGERRINPFEPQNQTNDKQFQVINQLLEKSILSEDFKSTVAALILDITSRLPATDEEVGRFTPVIRSDIYSETETPSMPRVPSTPRTPAEIRATIEQIIEASERAERKGIFIQERARKFLENRRFVRLVDVAGKDREHSLVTALRIYFFTKHVFTLEKVEKRPQGNSYKSTQVMVENLHTLHFHKKYPKPENWVIDLHTNQIVDFMDLGPDVTENDEILQELTTPFKSDEDAIYEDYNEEDYEDETPQAAPEQSTSKPRRQLSFLE